MPLKRLMELNTKDNLWVYVLRILADEPMHAYAFRDEVKKRYGFLPGTVTAYKVLYLLRKGGYVDKQTQGRQKIYSITPKGRKALKEASDFYKERVRMLENL